MIACEINDAAGREIHIESNSHHPKCKFVISENAVRGTQTRILINLHEDEIK